MADTDLYQLWLASPYGQVHVQANESKAQKQKSPTNWHKNIYKLLSVPDVLYPDGRMRPHKKILGVASESFKARWNRSHTLRSELSETPMANLPKFGADVERDALLLLIDKALQSYNRKSLTSKQKQIIILERTAKQSGVKNVSRYIAEGLNISIKGAEKGLSRTRKVKMGGYEGVSDIILLERKAKKDAHRNCCWCEKPTINGLRALCDDCEARFFYYGNYPSNLTPDDLQKRISKSNSEHWEKVLKAA